MNEEKEILLDNILKAITIVLVVHMLNYLYGENNSLVSRKLVVECIFVTVALLCYSVFIRPILILKKAETKLIHYLRKI